MIIFIIIFGILKMLFYVNHQDKDIKLNGKHLVNNMLILLIQDNSKKLN
jgi:hypothetical protein